MHVCVFDCIHTYIHMYVCKKLVYLCLPVEHKFHEVRGCGTSFHC